MSRLLSDAGKSIGKSISLAYGLNTIGAVLGCLATGLHLIPRLGIQASTYVALGINGVVVVVALLYRQPSFAPAPDRGATTPFTGRESFLLTGMNFTTGLVALGLEIVWMRILAIYCTSGVTTFTLALSTYLLGFSTGSLVIFPWLSVR